MRCACSIIGLLLALPAEARIAIDLATEQGDLVCWGAHQDSAAAPVQLADLNGDGLLDLAVGESGWDDVPRGVTQAGRVVLFLGPLGIPGELDLLDAVPSVEIRGELSDTNFGGDLVAADLDSDGYVDLLMSAADAFPGGGRPNAGAVIVFRGRPSWPSSLAYGDADWVFHGAEADDSMTKSAIGDLNGDGAADLVLSAASADAPGDARDGAGESYIFFGPPSRWSGREVDLAVEVPDVLLLGADGRLDNPASSPGDGLGSSISVADVLADNTPDLVIGARSGAGPANSRRATGEVYVLRGRPSWPAVIDLRADAPDLMVFGSAESSALKPGTTGDWNNDGEVDLLLMEGTSGFLPAGRESDGVVHVFTDRTRRTGVIDLAVDPSDGRVFGARSMGLAFLLAMADFDGDGFQDLITTSIGDSGPLDRRLSGVVQVVSGCDAAPLVRDLAVQPADFEVYGGEEADHWGKFLSVGDVDRDGRTDLASAAHYADGVGNLRPGSGEVHLFHGRELRAPTCSVAAVAGSDQDVCGVVDVTLTGSATVIGCTRSPAYRWLAGPMVVRDWSPDPIAVVRPVATTSYQLDVRCGECAGPCLGQDEVTVRVDPDLTPSDVGNTLLLSRRGIDVELGWTGSSNARTYRVYRGVVRTAWPPVPELRDLVVTNVRIEDVAAPDDYLYRVVGASCSGVEGP